MDDSQSDSMANAATARKDKLSQQHSGQSEDGPASHFFTTVLSAAQTAASSLAGMKNNAHLPGTAGHVRSLSDTDLYNAQEYQPEYDNNNNNEEHHSRVNDVVFEPLRSAISTLGKGELSLASLGIENEQGQQQPDEARSKEESLAGDYDDDTQTETVDLEDDEGTNNNQTEFSQGGTLAIPVMSRSKSRASSLISKHRGRKRTQSLNSTVESTNSDSPPSGDEATGGQITGLAYANKKRNRDFHRLFRSVQSDDYLLDDFSCALSKEILVHGRLYVSEKHVCFNSNILGWVTNLVIAFDEIVSLEKKNTAGLFPNGIIIQTLHARHSFASFVSRDSALEFLTSIWKQASPHQAARLDSGVATARASLDSFNTDDSGSETDGYEDDDDDDDDDDDEDKENKTGFDSDDMMTSDSDSLGSFGGSSSDDKDIEDEEEKELLAKKQGEEKKDDDNDKDGKGWPVVNLGPETHAPTETGIDLEKNGEKHLSTDDVAAPLGVVANILFGDDTAWMKRFVLENQKNQDLDDMPQFKQDSTINKKLRQYEYIKPLNAPVGPKQTKCICTDTIEDWDLDDKVIVITSTQTPDVPSGGSFVTKTRMALCWAEDNHTKIVISYWMEWSGKSWIKGAIERGAHDGQNNFAVEIVKEINKTLATKKQSKTSTPTAGKQKPKKEEKEAGPSGFRAGKKQPAQSLFSSIRDAISSIVELLSISPLDMIPIPIWGYLLMGVVAWYAFSGASAKPSGLFDQNRIDKLMLEEEYELWRWIDDRGGASSKSSNSNSRRGQLDKPVDVSAKYNKQQLTESIKITEERLKMLKELI